MAGVLPLAVGCAVAGAAAYGLAGSLQERATKTVPQDQALLGGLVRNPMWLAGTVVLGAGLVLQIVALAFGPLVLVQPLGVTSAIFATAATGRRLDRVVLTGAIACAAGLALFLVLARPTAPANESDPHRVPVLVAICAVLVLASLAVSRVSGGEVRALLLAVSAGICYGFTAALLKVCVAQLQAGGVAALVTHWTVYLACVTGPPGFLLSQRAFQQGKLVALALAVITTVDPLVAVAMGVAALGERVTTEPIWAFAGEVAGAAAIVVGVTMLARHGERLRHTDNTAGSG